VHRGFSDVAFSSLSLPFAAACGAGADERAYANGLISTTAMGIGSLLIRGRP